jgi:hypothetical protein
MSLNLKLLQFIEASSKESIVIIAEIYYRDKAKEG